MSTAVTMEELEFETAELLPSRETLGCCCHRGGFTLIRVDVDVDVSVLSF